MQLNTNKILETLDKIPLEHVNNDKQVPNTTNINLNQSINSNNSITLALIFFAALILTALIIINSNRNISIFYPSDKIYQQRITKKQGDEISNLVRAVAKCEGEHYQSIYSEIREITKTQRYREMDSTMYPVVKTILESRLCNK